MCQWVCSTTPNTSVNGNKKRKIVWTILWCKKIHVQRQMKIKGREEYLEPIIQICACFEFSQQPKWDNGKVVFVEMILKFVFLAHSLEKTKTWIFLFSNTTMIQEELYNSLTWHIHVNTEYSEPCRHQYWHCWSYQGAQSISFRSMNENWYMRKEKHN